MYTIENIMDYEKHPEIYKLIKSYLPIKNINGRDQVPDSFIKETLSIDPICFAERMLGEVVDKSLETSYIFLGTHLKSALLKEISKINFDFNANNSTWDQYIQGVKNLGFEEILSKHEKNSDVESDIMFKHKDYTIIWIVNSFNGYSGKTVNASFIYFNGTLKYHNTGSDIPLNLNYQLGTDIICGSLDMKEMPSYYLTRILSTFNIVDHLIDNNIYLLKLMDKDKLLTLDKDVLEKIFLKATRINGKYENSLNFEVCKDFYKKVISFYEKYSESERERIHIYGDLMDGRYSRRNFLPKDVLEDAIEFGFNEEDIPYLTAQIIYFDKIYKNAWEDIELAVTKLRKEDLLILLDVCESKKEESFSPYHFSDETFNLIKSLL